MEIKSLTNNKKIPIDIKDLNIGDEKNFEVLISEDLHEKYRNLSGDNSPIHTDLNFCKKNGYKKKLGYAFLLTDALSQIFGMFYPGGNELCLHQTCNFRNPFYVGEKLNIKIKIIQINKSKKLVSFKIKIINEKNALIFDGQTILQLVLEQ